MKTRREFLTGLTAATALATTNSYGKTESGTKAMRTRPFSKSGKSVTELCIGGSHVGGKDNPKDAEALIETAIEEGVRFFDTSRMYQDGRSETYYGKFLTPKYRDDIFLLTKTLFKDAKGVREELETSLKLMKTDYLDVWTIHSITSPEDVNQRYEAGVIDEFFKAKEEGLVKHIGFTGHRSYAAHLRMLELLDEKGLEMEACMLPINLVDPHYDSFIVNVVPELQKRNYAILAMKTLAFGRMLGKPPSDLRNPGNLPKSMEKDGVGVKDMHQFVYSLPITSLVSGCETPDEVRENVNTSKNFKGLSSDEKERLLTIAEAYAGREMEHYKA